MTINAADRHPSRQPRRSKRGARSRRRWPTAAARAGRHRQPRPRHRLGRRRPASSRWARPRVRSRLLQRIGRANHRLDEAQQGDPRARQPLRISRSPRGARRGRWRRARRRHLPPRRARRAGPAYHGLACAGRSTRRSCCTKVRSAGPYAALTRASVRRVLEASSRPAAMRSRPMTVPAAGHAESGRHMALAHPRSPRSIASTPASSSSSPMLDVRFANGRKLGTIEEGFASTLRPATISSSPAEPRGRADQGHRDHRPRLHQVGAHPEPTAARAWR
jgi:hypothetical protein